jgi:hypothetical protein
MGRAERFEQRRLARKERWERWASQEHPVLDALRESMAEALPIILSSVLELLTTKMAAVPLSQDLVDDTEASESL